MRVPLVKVMLGAVIVLAAASLATLVACGEGARYSQVAVGSNHSCGLRTDGSVVCWGANDFGQLLAPEDERFDAITAGGIYTCGLRSNGTAVCWGHFSGVSEDLARALTGDGLHSPPFPPEDESFTAIEAKGEVTCGFRTGGGVVCWNIRREFSPFGAEEVVEIHPGGYPCLRSALGRQGSLSQLPRCTSHPRRSDSLPSARWVPISVDCVRMAAFSAGDST